MIYKHDPSSQARRHTSRRSFAAGPAKNSNGRIGQSSV